MADTAAPTAHEHTNRLAGETSPYLLQHAHNPVDWWPWGADALARAKDLDRPIFLSIGYAACHWCHVMERESFENETTAAVLNAGFIPIKVDREERPDLDQLYMGAVQAMTGGGGWPMSVFLTPDGRPFYGGTYFPDEPRHGLPSFRQVLEGVSQAWQKDRSAIEAAGGRLVSQLVEAQGAASTGRLPDRMTLDRAAATIEAQFDASHGGWGRAPKFPQPMTIEFLLRRHVATADPRPLAVARRSLDAMAAGGIHDQLGGGFHRYSTTAEWLVPHFEQMLYDNAQLARAYVHAWTVTRDETYRSTARAALEYMLRELRTPDGGFAASQDADTEGVEGATFTWTAAQIRDVLGEDAAAFCTAYGVTERGNWEETNILSLVDSSVDAERFADDRARLLARRQQRAQPGRDDKVLASWNGLAIGAFADAARAFGDERYRKAGIDAATAVTDHLLVDGRLKRSWKDGRATADGVLEDYADLAEGLLALYEATGDERWFRIARSVADAMLGRFADPAGGFFDTAIDAERLVARPKDVQDNAVPSGNAMATVVLLRMAAFTGEGRYRDAAEGALATVAPYLDRYPTGFAQWLTALDLAHADDAVEIAIVGDPADDATRALLEVVERSHRPHAVLAVARDPASSVVPLMADRVARDGRPTAYVCRSFVCRLPVTEPDALARELDDRAEAGGST